MRIARNIEPIIRENKILDVIGSNTYTIMINHLLGFMCLKVVFAIIAKFTPLFPDFDFTRLKSDYAYFYLPNSLSIWYSVYIMMGIGISLLMKIIVLKLRHYGEDIWKIIFLKWNVEDK